MESLFPEWHFSFAELLRKVFTGDIFGAFHMTYQDIIQNVTDTLAGTRTLLCSLLVLGILATLITHFSDIFDKHQAADIGYYFTYLVLITILIGAFSVMLKASRETLENIVVFVKLLAPVYMISVGVANGVASVSVSNQLLLLLIGIIEKLLMDGLLPLVKSFFVLSVVNGIWIEEKLALLTELFEKVIGFLLKAALGILTGLGIFKTLITPAIDAAGKNTIQKVIAAIPGVGDLADSAMQIVLGSATIIKNSIGVTCMIVLIVLCSLPLCKALCIAGILKGSAALLGTIGDKKIVECINKAGDAVFLIFKVIGTAMVLFLIAIATVTGGTHI